MNMLVHFVKTPLHQINGFSDVLVNTLAGLDRPEMNGCSESAKYIKTATADLTRAVNRLLQYHRLDDLTHNLSPHEMLVPELIEEFSEAARDRYRVDCDAGMRKIRADRTPIKVALVSLAEYYAELGEGISRVNVGVAENIDGIRIEFDDDGEQLTPDEFFEKTKPLTKIDNYLTIDGAKMPMLLRTVARAAQVAGGTFDHEATETGNRFTISVPDHAQSTAAA